MNRVVILSRRPTHCLNLKNRRKKGKYLQKACWDRPWDMGWSLKFDRVGGLDDPFNAIARLVLASRANPKATKRLGISHVRGILLSGPPGCRKTLLARELALSTNTVWDDLRTMQLAVGITHRDIYSLRSRTGLPLASYFAGTQVRYLLDNVNEPRDGFMNPGDSFTTSL